MFLEKVSIVSEDGLSFRIVQHLVMPHGQFGASDEMYARLDGGARVDASQEGARIAFDAGARVAFDTYFNALSVMAWKQHARLDDLHLVLNGRGRFRLRIGLLDGAAGRRWLDERIVDLRGIVSIPISAWPALKAGMLFFALEALDEGQLDGGWFGTSSAYATYVKLGVVITHFNRKQYVLPAIERIREGLLRDPLYHGKIELVVVDNSRSIHAGEAVGATLIPSRNLGGSGGFARGLLHLKDEGSFTHCLFMDDDASCEIESIRRAYALLSLCPAQSNVAIAGSLLRERLPGILHEKGARFQSGNWISLGKGLDMRSADDLLAAESMTQQPNYGAWWFFAFPIASVRHFPFPFFVRGDDALFSLQNRFNLVALNGIGCWGEDFELKDGPFTRYFGFRATALLTMLTASEGRRATLMVLLQFIRWTLTALFSYDYASARAVCWAMEDVLKGPRFFVDNLDTTAVRERLAGLPAVRQPERESSRPADLVFPEPGPERRSRTLLRWATLNGLLLPSGFLKGQTIYQPKGFRATFRQIFGYRRVYYESADGVFSNLVAHEKKALAVGLLRCAHVVFRVLFRARSVMRTYRSSMDALTSERFWRDNGT